MSENINKENYEQQLIADSFDWIILDSNFEKNDPEIIKKAADNFGISISELYRVIKNSKNEFLNSDTKADKKLKKFITHLVLISNETLYLFDNDKEKALKWIQTPNDFFIDNLSPFEMALVGKGKSVLKKLCEFSGRDSDHLID